MLWRESGRRRFAGRHYVLAGVALGSGRLCGMGQVLRRESGRHHFVGRHDFGLVWLGDWMALRNNAKLQKAEYHN